MQRAGWQSRQGLTFLEIGDTSDRTPFREPATEQSVLSSLDSYGSFTTRTAVRRPIADGLARKQKSRGPCYNYIHMRSRFGALTPVLGVLIMIAIGAAAYAAQASAEPGATGYAEYRNSNFGFSLTYPADMTVSETSQGDRHEHHVHDRDRQAVHHHG